MPEFWVKYRKLIIIVAVILLVLILWSQIKKWTKNQKRKNTFKSDYDNLIASGQKPTYPETAYIQMADKIYEAGCPGGSLDFCTGTDEQAITDTFDQLNNELDALLLVRAFGSREPRGTIWSDSVDLGGFLLTELNGSDIAAINQKLKSRGIKYSF